MNIDADAERVTSEALCKAQEDRDLIADFAFELRAWRETIALLEDDEPASVSMKMAVARADRPR